MKKLATFVTILFFSLNFAFSQKTEIKAKITPSISLLNKHVWRGSLNGKAPSIQPSINFTYGGLTIGAWAGYCTDDSYREFDLYVEYTTGAFTASLYDYYCPRIEQDSTEKYDYSNNDAFDYSKNTTRHTFDLMLSFNGTENIPFRCMASTFLYGDDKDKNGDIYYSTYIELGYMAKLQNNDLDFFVGFTPFKGLYSDKFEFINAGLSVSRTLKVTQSFKLPMKATIFANPKSKDIFFVFKVSI